MDSNLGMRNMAPQRHDQEEEKGKTGCILRTTPGQVGSKHRMKHREMKLVRPQKPVHELSCVPEEEAWDFSSKQEDPLGFQPAHVL